MATKPNVEQFKANLFRLIVEQFKANLFRLIEELSVHLENQKILAKITRAKYNALISEGFTETQAIELCKG